MDPERFDALTRLLGTDRSRRGLGSLLRGIAVGGVLPPLLGLTDADAKKKRKKKKKKKKKKTTSSCVPACIDKVCGGDGCGGSCGQCEVCRECIAGSCATQPNSTPCGNGRTCQGGICFCPTACCADVDCPAGEGCFSGTCVIRQGTCPTGQDLCLDPTAASLCGGGACFCRTTIEGQTRCGGNAVSECSVACTSSAQCEAMFPAMPGVHCATNGQEPACECAIDNYCAQPCAV